MSLITCSKEPLIYCTPCQTNPSHNLAHIFYPHPFYYSFPFEICLFPSSRLYSSFPTTRPRYFFYPMHATCLILLDFISLLSPYLTSIAVSVVIRLLSGRFGDRFQGRVTDTTSRPSPRAHPTSYIKDTERLLSDCEAAGRELDN